MKSFFLSGLLIIIIVSSCSVTRRGNKEELPNTNAASAPEANKAKVFIKPISVDRNDFVATAKKLLGVTYKYGSAIPESGLDCSGFVYYVFSQFNIKAPRTTVAFTYEGKEVTLNKARVGDIILFTGSNHASGVTGHMGIITNTNKPIMFIHSASGKSVGVILNTLTGYYQTHFIKVISVFE